MEILDRQCEKFMGAPNVRFGDRLHVTINRMGTIYLNQRVLSLIGMPQAVYLYYNREKDMIILEPTQAVTAQAAFSVSSSPPPIKGRYIFANPFCKHFNIRVTTTQKFIDPTTDAAGRLYLKLRETISVALAPRGSRKKKAL